MAQAGYFNDAPVVSCNQTISRTLQTGSQNSDVVTLQNFLSRSGYLQANANGYFGYQTKQAVKHFQADNTLQISGVVGEATRNALNERLCDADVSAQNAYDSFYGDTSNNGVTYVNTYDPNVVVINPPYADPVVYATPQTYLPSHTNPATYTSPVSSTVATSPVSQSGTFAGGITPSQNQISGNSIVFNPGTGYVVGVREQVGSLTISSPRANTIYKEGDTILVTWATTNIHASGYVISLENKSSKITKTVAVTSTNSTSFVLSKELLDAMCLSICDTAQQAEFSVVVSTPVTDIAGTTSLFKASVSPILVRRSFSLSGFGATALTASKNIIETKEAFKLYVNIPTGTSWNGNAYDNYSFKVRATCPAGVQVSMAGTLCGQDIALPVSKAFALQEIPVIMNNSTLFKQDVTFELVVSSKNGGQVISVSNIHIAVNGTPLTW